MVASKRQQASKAAGINSVTVEKAVPWSQQKRHPYRSGNYLSLNRECPLTPVPYIGELPVELAESMYIRNGGNPTNEITDADAYHWFDGYGALAGVLFRVNSESGKIEPEFVNRFVLTDIFLSDYYSAGRKAILPSIATLLGPIRSLHLIIWAVLRSVVLVIMSFFTKHPIYRISAANTNVLYHDGRALATCESGPPLWVSLPSLDTVDWWSLGSDDSFDPDGLRGKGGLLGMVNEWTTAHPKRDLDTGELLLFHSSFVPPFLKYSVVPSTQKSIFAKTQRILSHPVPIAAPRMMHDFAASQQHTILIDCPLSLDPSNLAKGNPVVHYSPNTPTRFGILPRHHPEQVRWYESESCIIFHTANAWTEDAVPEKSSVHLVCARLNSSTLVYAAGNLPLPDNIPLVDEVCQLYYYRFPLGDSAERLAPSHAFPLSAIPFEFPEVSRLAAMKDARYVYGCTMRQGSFSAALGKAAKIDCLVKVDVLNLSAKGRQRTLQKADIPVDSRSVYEVLATQAARTDAPIDNECIRVFSLPADLYGQECSFVPRHNQRGEDDGFLLMYVFDETQLDEFGEAPDTAVSELWVIDAWNMTDVLARVQLPQRVPYGLHGEHFTAEEIASQRTPPSIRTFPKRGQDDNHAIINYLQKKLD